MADIPYDEQSFRLAFNSEKELYIVKKNIPGRGWGLVARGKSFKEARETVVWTRKPWVLSIQTSKLQERCYQCFRIHTRNADNQQAKGDGAYPVLKSCMGCHTVKYCGKKCQSRSWKEHHKYECKTYGSLQPRALPSPVRAVIRILKHRDNGRLDDGDWTDLLSLESHQDDLSRAGGKHWQDVFLMAKAAQQYSGTKESLEVVLKLSCILAVNSFTLTDTVLEPLGIAFDPMAAMLNHSCDPNCIIRFDTDPFDPTLRNTSVADPILGSISVDLLRPIKDGEELTISYIDNTFPLSKRQADLSSRYFFTCSCSRCSRVTNTPFDKLLKLSLSSMAAQTEANAVKVLNAAISEPSALQLMIPILKDTLTHLSQDSTFPVHRYPYAQLRHQLVLALIDSGAWYEAMLQSGILVYRIDPILYAEPHHPIRMVNKWRFFRLARHLCVEIFDARTMPAVNEDQEMMLKMTVVVTIMTLQFERPKGTVRMPASTLDSLLTQAKAEIMRANLLAEEQLEEYSRTGLFDGPLEAYRLAPKQVEETLKKDWEGMIEKALEEEKDYNPSPEKTTEEVRKLTEKMKLRSEERP